MYGFFEMLEQLWVSVSGFVVSWVGNLVSSIYYIVDASQYITKAIAFLPPILLVPAAAVIAIAVLHIITLSS